MRLQSYNNNLYQMYEEEYNRNIKLSKEIKELRFLHKSCGNLNKL